jgi:5'-AMP-activated protein kinase catalytic alpha subunit
LRPETIIFETASGVSDIKLVDFISTIETKDIIEDDLSFDHFIKSTPDYRSPELISKRKFYNSNCDVWSCGAILYNMITGIPPFFENDLETLEEKIKLGVFSCSFPNYEKNNSV